MDTTSQARCPHEQLAATMAYMACMGAGEWLLALGYIDPMDEHHDDEIVEDMARAMQLFASALHAFDGLARALLDLKRREMMEQLRQDVVAFIGDGGLDFILDADVAEIVLHPLDLAPGAEAGEVRQ